ncbi:MAG: SusC/RagA family TonB-linked outer membrane protein [Lentimicrobiaceae bacterium]|jgi:TonB-linked SusC/RagA family outer membrane protein
MRKFTILFVLLLLGGMQIVFAQKTITGKVTNKEDGLGLPGATIAVTGTTTATITDVLGKYSLQVPANATSLHFTFIGMKPLDVSIGAQKEINVTLEPEITSLDELVVVGYTSRKLSQLSSSVSVISSKKLQDVTSNNVTDLLQGKAPGIVVSSATGDPNATPSIIIRGTSSITAGSDPLYVVDGIIGGNANPNDIESVTILKDAAATGLYGSRASNGVIIINTKRGKSGKTQINVSSTVGFNKVSEGNYQVMNSQQLYDYQKTFWNPTTWEQDRPSSLLAQNTNWHDLMFRTGMTQNHSISISGGSDKTQVYVSGNYYNEQGTLGPNDNKAYNIRSNISHNINDKLKLSVRLNAKTKQIEEEAAGTTFLINHENMPWDNPYNPDGSLRKGTEEGWIGRDNDNFLYDWQYNFDRTKQSSLDGDITLEYYITKDLTFSTYNRASYSNGKRELYYDVRTKAGLGEGSLTNDFNNSSQLITSNRLLYKKTFDKHNFSAIAVAEAEKNYSDFTSIMGVGLAPGLHVMNVASVLSTASSITGENAFNKGLVQLDYNFNNRYFVVGSFIRESSSRFGANNRAANFYTLGSSWIISNESFMKDQKFFDLLKIRASYGLTGNAQIGDYQTLGLYSFSTQYAGNSGSFPSQMANNNLTWEKAEMINFGLDVGLFNRISLNMEIYQKSTKALLLNVQIPYTTGFSSVIQNVGSVRNRGLEFNLNTVNLDGELRWETNFNIAFNNNRVMALDQGKDILENGIQTAAPTRIISVGHDLNSWYMRKWAGVDPANGDPLWEKVTVGANGDKTVTTTNKYSDATLQFVGAFTPKFTGGINNVFIYKAFSLSALFNFVKGDQVYFTSAFVTDSDGAYDTENQKVLAPGESRWQKPGDIVTHPKPVYGGNLNSNRVSSRYLQDGSYIRMRNVRFSYELPFSLLKREKIANATVFISGDNLWTVTKFTGKDPQAAFNRAGGEVGDYPTSKKILIGINIGF